MIRLPSELWHIAGDILPCVCPLLHCHCWYPLIFIQTNIVMDLHAHPAQPLRADNATSKIEEPLTFSKDEKKNSPQSSCHDEAGGFGIPQGACQDCSRSPRPLATSNGRIRLPRQILSTNRPSLWCVQDESPRTKQNHWSLDISTTWQDHVTLPYGCPMKLLRNQEESSCW